jgi:hypothetical protein
MRRVDSLPGRRDLLALKECSYADKFVAVHP